MINGTPLGLIESVANQAFEAMKDAAEALHEFIA